MTRSGAQVPMNTDGMRSRVMVAEYQAAKESPFSLVRGRGRDLR